MERIYKECWKKANDKTTPRKEYLDALYCLQSLYALQRWFDGLGDSKRKIGFRGYGVILIILPYWSINLKLIKKDVYWFHAVMKKEFPIKKKYIFLKDLIINKI